MRVGKAKRLTHLDERGAARMVDVAAKASTVREALAECVVRMAPATLRAVKAGTAKGDALQVGRRGPHPHRHDQGRRKGCLPRDRPAPGEIWWPFWNMEA